MSNEMTTTSGDRPDWLPAVAEENEFVLDVEDLKIPWIFMSHEKTDFCDPGDYYDSLTKTVYEQPVQFIPLHTYKQYRKKKGTETEFLTRDRSDTRIRPGELDWVNKTPPAIQTEAVFFILTLPDLQLCKLSFYRTSYDAAKNLFNFFTRFKGHMHERYYELRSHKGKGEYYIKTSHPGSFVTKEQYETASKWVEKIAEIAGSESDSVEAEF